MKIVPLFKVCAENNIKNVCVGNSCFQVGSVMYTDQKEWFVKGEYQIEGDTLKCQRLEKDVTISINRPVINGEKLPEEQLDEMINELVTCIVFDRETLESAGNDIKRAHVPAFAESVLKSYHNRTGRIAQPESFGIVLIDWEKRKVILQSLPK